MCVIITKEPGFHLPEQKLINAMRANKDGAGVIVFGDNGDYIHRKFKQISPDELLRFLEQFDDNQLALHLRYRTAGDVSLRNAHPFPVLNKKLGDDRDLFVMHNGTFSVFSDRGSGPSESDTRLFTKKLLRPLLLKFKPEELDFNNYAVKHMLDSLIPSNNVVTLIDATSGTILRLKESERGAMWHDDRKWWSSNNSYFWSSNDNAYDSSPYSGIFGGGVGSRRTYHTPSQRTPVMVPPPPPPPTKESPTAKREVKKYPRKTFCELLEVSEGDITCISDESIELLVRESPEDAILLIHQLLSIAADSFEYRSQELELDEEHEPTPYTFVHSPLSH